MLHCASDFVLHIEADFLICRGFLNRKPEVYVPHS